MTVYYTSKVMLLFLEIPVQRMQLSAQFVGDLNQIHRFDCVVLRGVKPFWRPLLRVVWVVVQGATIGEENGLGK